ncbi:phospholipase A2 [Streptomyces platensis]|uniref:phospholipase A2 n=1 Tax=Streptomyces platensis TaxID=58346 RepID=UPI002E272A0D
MAPDPDADGRTPSAPKTRANAVSKNSPEIRGGIHSAKPQSLRRRILRRPTTGRTGAVVAGVLTAVFLSALPAAAEPSVGSSPVVLSRIVGAPEDHLYGLAADHSAVYEQTGSNTHWEKIGGPASDLYAGGAGLFATRPDTGALYKYDGTPEAWSEIGNAGTDFAVTDHHVYGLTPDRIAVFEWEGKGTEWKAKRAPIVSGETRQAKLERMKQLTEPGLPATSDWFDALSQHLQGVPDPFVFDWANDGCSKVPDTFQGFDFKNACNRHDFGYRNYQSLLGEQNFLTTSVGQEAKKRVDDIFLQDLQAECNFKMWPIDPRSDFSRQQCRRIAKGYYEGVVNLYKG